MTHIDKPEDKSFRLENVVFSADGGIILADKPRAQTYDEELVGLYRKLKRENSAGVLM